MLQSTKGERLISIASFTKYRYLKVHFLLYFNCVLSHPSVQQFMNSWRIGAVHVCVSAPSRLFNQQLCLNGYLYMLTVLSATSFVWPNEDQTKGEAAPRRENARNLSPAQTKWTRWTDRKSKEGFPRLSKHKCKTELRNSWLVPVKTVVAAAEMSHEGPFSHTKFRFYRRCGQIWLLENHSGKHRGRWEKRGKSEARKQRGHIEDLNKSRVQRKRHPNIIPPHPSLTSFSLTGNS